MLERITRQLRRDLAKLEQLRVDIGSGVIPAHIENIRAAAQRIKLSGVAGRHAEADDRFGAAWNWATDFRCRPSRSRLETTSA